LIQGGGKNVGDLGYLGEKVKQAQTQTKFTFRASAGMKKIPSHAGASMHVFFFEPRLPAKSLSAE
jgi:hypothetical protein